MVEVAVVYHSRGGTTRRVARAVASGASEVEAVEVHLVDVDDAVDWALLARVDALVFGCPTFMGSVSAPFKAFMDASSREAWATQSWKDKLAAGFTNSSGQSGDKLATLIQLAVFAAQHGMIWVSLGLMPGHNTSRGSDTDLNRLGSHLGAMAQSNADQPTERATADSDLRTAAHLGRRVARAASRWAGRAVDAPATDRHPATASWVLPPERDPGPVPRVNLRALMARPERFEHHLVVVGTVGDTQLEVATASEPLPFAHVNLSDELAISLDTGDPLMGMARFLTLFADPRTGRDVGRVKHRAGDLVLHPHGLLHWPGRLRPPWRPHPFGPGMRRCALNLVFCGSVPIPPSPSRPLDVPPDRQGDVKAYDAPVPFHLVATPTAPEAVVARVGEVSLTLRVDPARIEAPRGAYVVVLEGSEPHFPGDLLYVAPGTHLDGTGLARVLVAAGDAPAHPPPPSWQRLPTAPFAPYEDAAPGTLPIDLHGLVVHAHDENVVRAVHGEVEALVPRYWLARFLFRVALHQLRVGYVETYGGWWWDDRDGSYRLGLRGTDGVSLSERAVLPALEALYRAVAPSGYTERLL